MQEDFLTGFLGEANQRFSGGPAGVLAMPGGSPLVSDGQLGAICRIACRR